MDIAFFDPDRSHADHLRSALESYITTDALARKWRAAKYGADVDAGWRRGSTPDDVRAHYDHRLQAALRELREATPESEDDGDEGDGEMAAMSVQAYPRVKGAWRAKVVGELATPPTSGDEEDECLRVVGKRKRECSVEGSVEDVKKLCVETRLPTCGQRLATPRFSPKRRSHAPARFPRVRKADGIELYNTHSMTTRSKTRKFRNPG